MIAQENHRKRPNVLFERIINQENGFDLLTISLHTVQLFINVPHSYQFKREIKNVLVKKQCK